MFFLLVCHKLLTIFLLRTTIVMHAHLESFYPKRNNKSTKTFIIFYGEIFQTFDRQVYQLNVVLVITKPKTEWKNMFKVNVELSCYFTISMPLCIQQNQLVCKMTFANSNHVEVNRRLRKCAFLTSPFIQHPQQH